MEADEVTNQQAVGLGVFVLVFLIVYLLHTSRRQQAQNDIRKVLIDRFGSAQDLGAFLQSEGGREFIAGLSSSEVGALSSVLASVQRGVILLLLGFGCAGAQVFISQVFLGIGVVLMSAGIGFLVSAVVTYGLSKSWGLLGKH
jgi:hypothetical protein